MNPRKTLISAVDLSERIALPGLVVVDCRFSLADPLAGERAYAAGHIPSAIYAHLERDLSGTVEPGKTGRHPLPNPEALARKLGEWGVDSNTQLVVYDDAAGAMAARLWWLARWLGHEAVAVLDGGYPAWIAAGLLVVDTVPTPVRREFRFTLRNELIADASEVESARTDPSRRVFDARAEERYLGDVEPIDPVAGHIPGARSLPFSQNLENGTFKKTSDLRAHYEAALAGVPADRAIAYCGSGVTACHTVLAAHHAGFDGVRLYPGSWSEWIADPSRPVAREE